MFTGACVSPNADFSKALPQPILGLKTNIHAMAMSKPGMANDNSAKVWNRLAPGASVRSTVQATHPPKTNVMIALATAKSSELRSKPRICQPE